MPRLSIFIPVYNAGKFIAETIDSVLAQTYTDWELIIVEDRSSDNSFEIAKRYEAAYPEKIKVYQNDTNLGMLRNWNRGIDLCRNELFVKLDADDIWLPTFLEKSVHIIDKYPEAGLVFTKYVNIDEAGNVIDGSEIVLPDFAREKLFSTTPLVLMGQKKMLSYPILRQGLSVMRRAVFEKIGKYRFLITEKTQAATDTEFYYRIGMHYGLFCIDETLYKYRVHENSISKTDKENQLSSLKEFELKTTIINYFFEHKKITEEQYKKDTVEIIFKHNTFLIQYWFKKKKPLKSLCFFVKTLLLAPVSTIVFYKDRLLKR